MEQIPKEVIMRLAEDIRKERCRKLSDRDVEDIVEEMKVEQIAGKTAMEEIMTKGFGINYGGTKEDWR
jgi:hypothetical protein